MLLHRLWLLAVFCLLSCCSSSTANALAPEYAEPFHFWLRQGIKDNHPYVWGASDPEVLTYDTKGKQWKRGLDCSGYVYWAGRKAAIPGIRRITAHDMSLGRDGWTGTDVLLGALEELDIVFWDWKPQDGRIDHIGVLLRDLDTGFPSVAHASSKRGVVLVPLERGPVRRPDAETPQLWRDLTKARRLNIGDKR